MVDFSDLFMLVYLVIMKISIKTLMCCSLLIGKNKKSVWIVSLGHNYILSEISRWVVQI